MKTAYDVVIVGSGVVGASLALAIAKQTSLTVAVVEAKENHYAWHTDNDYDARVSAISHASKHTLKHLGVWETIQSKRVNPYTKMRVWDAEGSGVIFFDAADIGESNLGYIIEDHVIRSSLLEKYSDYENIDYICPFKVTKLKETEESITLMSDEGRILNAGLLIAADGADSWLRKARHIDIQSYDYQHTAIVATVHTALSHQNTAWQRFLPQGPLAFLPLKDASSIVWSAQPEYADQLMQLNDHDFRCELAKQFDHTLGEITHVSSRYAFALRMRHAKSYVQNRFALIGDAAHTLHPLLGQGVNLGLLDAAALAEIIIDAYDKKRDYTSYATLRRYERARKTDTLTMLKMAEFLKQLFANQNPAVRCIRNVGLNVTNQIPQLKQFFMHYALGKRTDLPKTTRRKKHVFN